MIKYLNEKKSELPQPISKLYENYQSEEDERIKLRELIKLFTGLLKYLGVISISEYTKDPKSPKVNRNIYKTIERPSLGHWLSFVRSIIKHFENDDKRMRVGELQEEWSKEIERQFSHMINIRNKYVHPDVYPGREESESIIERNSKRLEKIFRRLDFIRQYPPILVTDSGRRVPLRGKTVQASQGENHKLIVNTDDDDINITPFILMSIDEEFGTMLVYESLTGNKASYILGNKIVVSDESKANAVRKKIDKLKTKKDAKNEDSKKEKLEEGIKRGIITKSALKSLSKEKSEKTFRNYSKRNIYDPETYVERKKFHNKYEKIKESQKNGFIVIADSGSGKSVEVCNMYVNTFSEDIVWILDGKKASSKNPFKEIETALLPDNTGLGFVDLINALKKDPNFNERFVILFDGLDETNKPVEAFQNINKVVSLARYNSFKVVVTCRSYFWHEIRSTGISIDKNDYILSSSDSSVSHRLGNFSESQIRRAVEKYSELYGAKNPSQWKEALTSGYHRQKLSSKPLILRLLFETFDEESGSANFNVSDELTVDTIISKHINQRLRQRDRNFLKKYVPDFCFHTDQKYVDIQALSNYETDHERRYKISPPKSYLKNLKKLVFRSQSYSKDRIWVCPNINCTFSKVPVNPNPDIDNPRCPSDKRLLQQVNVDHRSTYFKLKSENIISEQVVCGNPRFSFIYNIYLEYLIKNYILEELHEDNMIEVIDLIIKKSTKSSFLLNPVSRVLQNAISKERWDIIDHMAKKESKISENVLFKAYDRYAAKSFDEFLNHIYSSKKQTEFALTLRLALSRALLNRPKLIKSNLQSTADALLFLAQPSSGILNDRICERLVQLYRSNVSLIEVVIEKSSQSFQEALSLAGFFWIITSRKKRRNVKGKLGLFLKSLLFGLGNFFDKKDMRKVSYKNGISTTRGILDSKLFGWLEPFISDFVADKFKSTYRDKGPLPCNYWEILFQLEESPEKIAEASKLYYPSEYNLFDLEVDEMEARLTGSNGLISWYKLSILPVHFIKSGDMENSTHKLTKLLDSESQTVFYIASNTIFRILRKHGVKETSKNLTDAADKVENRLLNNPELIYLKPAPIRSSHGHEAKSHVFETSASRLSEDEKITYLPWIEEENGKVERFYLNNIVKHIALRKINNGSPYPKFVIDLLKRNEEENVLKFPAPEEKRYKFTVEIGIRSLEIIAKKGHLNEFLITVRKMIERFVINEKSRNKKIHKKSIKNLLKSVKKYRKNEIYNFIDSFETNGENFIFLDSVKVEPGLESEMFRKSSYGHNIYISIFENNQEVRNEFGRLTKEAASSSDVEKFFLTYVEGFLKYINREHKKH